MSNVSNLLHWLGIQLDRCDNLGAFGDLIAGSFAGAVIVLAGVVLFLLMTLLRLLAGLPILG